jgi:hypothetical protein
MLYVHDEVNKWHAKTPLAHTVTASSGVWNDFGYFQHRDLHLQAWLRLPRALLHPGGKQMHTHTHTHTRTHTHTYAHRCTQPWSVLCWSPRASWSCVCSASRCSCASARSKLGTLRGSSRDSLSPPPACAVVSLPRAIRSCARPPASSCGKVI